MKNLHPKQSTSSTDCIDNKVNPNINNQQYKLYVTGGIFTHYERKELDEIASLLESYGFNTYVPHRDGFELERLRPMLQDMGLSKDQAQLLLCKVIFAMDLFQVVNLDGVVFNMNGRVPDEGATVESTMTWMAGNMLFIYKDDYRCLTDGVDNPLIDGLVNFVKIKEKSNIPKTIQEWLKNNRIRTLEAKINGLPDKPRKSYAIGELFDKMQRNNAPLKEIVDKALEIFLPETKV